MLKSFLFSCVNLGHEPLAFQLVLLQLLLVVDLLLFRHELLRRNISHLRLIQNSALPVVVQLAHGDARPGVASLRDKRLLLEQGLLRLLNVVRRPLHVFNRDLVVRRSRRLAVHFQRFRVDLGVLQRPGLLDLDHLLPLALRVGLVL